MSLMAVEVCIYAKDGLYMVIINCRVQYMPLMTVEVCTWHLWLLSSMYVIDGCGGLYMAFMSVEVCIWHLWLQSSIYVIDSCGGLYNGCGGLYMSRAYICNGWYIGYEGQLMSIHIILYFFK